MNNIQNSPTYKNLPDEPGVYLFRDKNQKILYIGKALNLKNRARNYFDNQPKEERINNLLQKAEKINYFIVKSEIEALLLEARLIKEHRPEYNIRLKDDKRFLYVGITKEKYPQVALLRQPERLSNLQEWFGPFPSAASIKEILRMLRRVFPFRSCRNLTQKSCLYYHLKLCPGMCLGETAEYNNNIRKIKMFLNGKIELLVKNLNKEMKKASVAEDYEQAGNLKKQIDLIENLLQDHTTSQDEDKAPKQLEELRKILGSWSGVEPFFIRRLEAYDVANLGSQVVVGSMVVFLNGEKSTKDYRQFKLKSEGGDPGGIFQILSRRLEHQEWDLPQVILVDGGKTQITAAFQALREKKLTKQIPVLGLAKKEEKIIIPKIIDEEIKAWKTIKYQSSSLVHQLLQSARDEAHRFAQRYYKKLHQKITFPSELNR